MRVLFDTNVFISYLLTNAKDEIISSVIEAGFEHKYTLLLSHDVVREFNKILVEKSYLATHISKPMADEFIEVLSIVAETIPVIIDPIPEISTDKKDDYLFACGAIGEADYLVTGDKKLQKLKRVGDMKIVSPTEFYEILKKK